MKYIKTLLLFVLSTFSVSSQIEVKGKIILDGSDSLNRTVSGIAFPQDSSSAANTSSLLEGQLIYGQAIGVNQLAFDLIPSISKYTPGMVVNFKTSSANTGPVTIQLNGLSTIPVKKNGSRDIDSADFVSGQMVTAIFDGTYFQILSKLSRRCPSGFVNVNKDFCIETNERPVLNWFQATKTCGDMNARLCTQAEWAYVCQQADTLGVVNMIDNWEWIDSAGNSPDECKSMGKNSAGVAGCREGFTFLWSATKGVRCCYSK